MVRSVVETVVVASVGAGAVFEMVVGVHVVAGPVAMESVVALVALVVLAEYVVV